MYTVRSAYGKTLFQWTRVMLDYPNEKLFALNEIQKEEKSVLDMK